MFRTAILTNLGALESRSFLFLCSALSTSNQIRLRVQRDCLLLLQGDTLPSVFSSFPLQNLHLIFDHIYLCPSLNNLIMFLTFCISFVNVWSDLTALFLQKSFTSSIFQEGNLLLPVTLLALHIHPSPHLIHTPVFFISPFFGRYTYHHFWFASLSGAGALHILSPTLSGRSSIPPLRFFPRLHTSIHFFSLILMCYLIGASHCISYSRRFTGSFVRFGWIALFCGRRKACGMMEYGCCVCGIELGPDFIANFWWGRGYTRSPY